MAILFSAVLAGGAEVATFCTLEDHVQLAKFMRTAMARHGHTLGGCTYSYKEWVLNLQVSDTESVVCVTPSTFPRRVSFAFIFQVRKRYRELVHKLSGLELEDALREVLEQETRVYSAEAAASLDTAVAAATAAAANLPSHHLSGTSMAAAPDSVAVQAGSVNAPSNQPPTSDTTALLGHEAARAYTPTARNTHMTNSGLVDSEMQAALLKRRKRRNRIVMAVILLILGIIVFSAIVLGCGGFSFSYCLHHTNP